MSFLEVAVIFGKANKFLGGFSYNKLSKGVSGALEGCSYTVICTANEILGHWEVAVIICTANEFLGHLEVAVIFCKVKEFLGRWEVPDINFKANKLLKRWEVRLQ